MNEIGVLNDDEEFARRLQNEFDEQQEKDEERIKIEEEMSAAYLKKNIENEQENRKVSEDESKRRVVTRGKFLDCLYAQPKDSS